MKFPNLFLQASAFCFITQFTSADVVVLKDGSKVEGALVRETEKEVVIEIQVTRTIKDERIIKRENIASIEKEQEDEIAYKQIENAYPVPDLSTQDDYLGRIRVVEEFIKNYPKSSFVKAANASLEKLQKEAIAVADGGIKIGERLVTGDEYEANAYYFDSLIAERKIEIAIEQENFLLALRLFSEYERNFPNMSGKAALVPKMKAILNLLERKLEASLVTYEIDKEIETTNLAKMSDELREPTKKAIADEQMRMKKAYEFEKKQNLDWITPNSRYKPSMVTSLEQVKRKRATLKQQKSLATSAKKIDMAEQYRNFWQDLTLGTIEEKDKKLEEAKEIGLPEAYLLKLRQHAELDL